MAGDGGVVTWPVHIALLRVKQYLLAGDRIPAAVGVEMGLANFAVPAGEVLGQPTAFAHRLAAFPPQAVQDTKSLLNQIVRSNAVQVRGMGLAAECRSHDTVECAEFPQKMKF